MKRLLALWRALWWNRICPMCQGTGSMYVDTRCTLCSGKGRL